MSKLPVTWGWAKVFAGYSGFLHYSQLAGHKLGTIGINLTKKKIPNSLLQLLGAVAISKELQLVKLNIKSTSSMLTMSLENSKMILSKIFLEKSKKTLSNLGWPAVGPLHIWLKSHY